MRNQIWDRQTGRNIAYIEDGKLFDMQKQHVGFVSAGVVYSLEQVLLGHLEGIHITGKYDDEMHPVLKKLLLP